MLASAYLSRGYFYSEITNYEKAIDDLSKSIQLNPANPLSEKSANRAYVLSQQRYYNLAVYDCNAQRLMPWNPKETEAYRLKGNASTALGDYDDAIGAYSRVIEFNTNSALIYFSRGFAYSQTEDYKNGAADFGRSLQIDPTNAEAYSGRGICLSRLGDFQNGLKDCRKGFEINSNLPMVCNNLAWLLATAPKAKMRDGTKAVELATKACELTSWKDAHCVGTLAAARSRSR